MAGPVLSLRDGTTTRSRPHAARVPDLHPGRIAERCHCPPCRLDPCDRCGAGADHADSNVARRRAGDRGRVDLWGVADCDADRLIALQSPAETRLARPAAPVRSRRSLSENRRNLYALCPSFGQWHGHSGGDLVRGGYGDDRQFPGAQMVHGRGHPDLPWHGVGHRVRRARPVGDDVHAGRGADGGGGGLYSAGTGFLLLSRMRFHNTIWHGFVVAASTVFFVAVFMHAAQVA